MRGDVIDIYPADSERDALRIELFGDEVERLLWIDPLTGEVIKKLPGHDLSKNTLRDSKRNGAGLP